MLPQNTLTLVVQKRFKNSYHQQADLNEEKGGEEWEGRVGYDVSSQLQLIRDDWEGVGWR